MSNLLSEIKFLDGRAFGLMAALGIAMMFGCSPQNVERSDKAESVATPMLTVAPTQVQQPGDAPSMLGQLYETKNCRAFSEGFPSSFAEFDRLYGYDDQKGPGRLASVSEQHVDYFFSCSDVPDRDKLKKVINIGIDGKWDADAIGLFQGASYELIKKYPKAASEILDALPETKASSYWYFLLDSPHPQDKVSLEKVRVLRDVLGKETRQSKLLMAQHAKLKEDGASH